MSPSEPSEREEFVDGLRLEADVTADDFKTAMKGAIKDRSLIFLFIWRTLRDMYPDVDAVKVMQKASWEFGLVKGAAIARRIGGTDKNAKEVLGGQTSKGGMLVFEQEIAEFSDDRAVKLFDACPHLECFREQGATEEEMEVLCREMLCWGDYGTFAPFENVKMEWPETLSDSGGRHCSMTLTRK